MSTSTQYQLARSDGASWTVAEGHSLSLGRHRRSDVQIADPAVSRHHATLLVARGRCWIRDEDSTYGTYVNGRRVPGQMELRPGDTLQIGPATFGLQSLGVAAQQVAAGGAAQTGLQPKKRQQQILWAMVGAVVIVVLLGIGLATGRNGKPQHGTIVPSVMLTSTAEAGGKDLISPEADPSQPPLVPTAETGEATETVAPESITAVPPTPSGDSKPIPATGNSVSVGGIEFAAPPGGLSQDTEVVVSALPESESAGLVPLGVEMVSDLYDVQLIDAVVADEVGFSIPYDTTAVNPEVDDIFVAAYHDGQWRALASVIDADAGVVRALSSHLSLVGVFRDVLGQRPKIVAIQPNPNPYVYYTTSYHALTRDITVDVFVEDPADRIREATVRARFYTLRSELITGAVWSIGAPWSLFAEGNPDLGYVAPLDRKETNSAGLTRYSVVLPVSRMDFSLTGGASRVRFDVELETDGLGREESYNLNISGGERVYFELVSPATGDVVLQKPTFKWKHVTPTDHEDRIEVRICNNPELKHRFLLGGCQIIDVGQFDRELSGDLAPKLKRGDYWWGILVYSPSFVGGWNLAFQTASNLFSVAEIIADDDSVGPTPELQPPSKVGSIEGMNGIPLRIDFSPSGTSVAAVSLALEEEQGSVEVWDLQSGQRFQTLHTGPAYFGARFSPDGTQLLVWPWYHEGETAEKTLIFDPDTGRQTATLDHLTYVVDVAWHPAGQLLAVSSMDEDGESWAIDLWDVDTSSRVGSLRTEQPPLGLAFDPPGDRLAIVTTDELWDGVTWVELWDVPARRQIDTWPTEAMPNLWQTNLFWPGTESTLILAGIKMTEADVGRGLIYAWNADSRAELWRVDLPSEVSLWDDLWQPAAMTRDGRLLAMSVFNTEQSGTVHFVDLAGGRDLGPTWQIPGIHLWAAFNADGTLLATLPFDPIEEVDEPEWTGVIQLWSMTGE